MHMSDIIINRMRDGKGRVEGKGWEVEGSLVIVELSYMPVLLQ